MNESETAPVPTAAGAPTDSASMECMERFKHAWHWVWEGSRWTNRVRCMNCGVERVNEGTQA